MPELDDISVDALRDALDGLEASDPAVRLVAALLVKHGVSQSTLATWLDVERKTVYNWLNRLDPADLGASARDDPRPGRSPKLAAADRATVLETLRGPPAAAGFDAAAWTPDLVRRYVRDTHDVDYSRPSCRRLLRDAGLRYVRTWEGDADEGAKAPEDAETATQAVGGPAGPAGQWRPTASVRSGAASVSGTERG